MITEAVRIKTVDLQNDTDIFSLVLLSRFLVLKQMRSIRREVCNIAPVNFVKLKVVHHVLLKSK